MYAFNPYMDGMSGMEIFNCPLSSSPEKELPSPEIVSLSSPVPVPPLDSTKVANESGCLNVSTKHKNNQSTSKPNSNPSNGLPANLPFPSKFSTRVEPAFESGNVK